MENLPKTLLNKDSEITNKQISILIPIQHNHEFNMVEHNSLTGTWTVICYNLADSFLHRSSDEINVSKSILSATTCKIFYYNNKISLFVGKLNNHTWKLTLYSLNTETQPSTFKLVPHHSLSLTKPDFDSENWITVSNKDGWIIIASVISDQICFRVLSKAKKWLSAYSVLAQPLAHSLKVKISSAIVVSNNLYCSFVQQGLGARICQFSIKMFQQHQRSSINIRPVCTWHIKDDPTLQNCFLSTYKEEVIIVCCNDVNDKSHIEVRRPKSKSTVTSSALYRYGLPYKANIVGTPVDPHSENLVIAVIYRDIKDDKNYIKRIDMSPYTCTATQ